MKVKFIFLFLLLIFLSPCLATDEEDTPVSAQTEKTYFAPKDNLAKVVVSNIEEAGKYIHLAMYYFTSHSIAKSLIQAKKRNVDIEVLLDYDQKYNKNSRWDVLVEEGIKVKFFKSKGLMHNKFCIIDGNKVLTGSYNWTDRGYKENEENLIVINSSETAKEYEKEFQDLWIGEKIVPSVDANEAKYVGSKSTHIFHKMDCNFARRMQDKNKVYFLSREEAIKAGFRPCEKCKP